MVATPRPPGGCGGARGRAGDEIPPGGASITATAEYKGEKKKERWEYGGGARMVARGGAAVMDLERDSTTAH